MGSGWSEAFGPDGGCIGADGGEVGSTTAPANGSFTLTHDFGGPGVHTVYVQAKVAGKSLSVPSTEIDFEIPSLP